eukprot:gene20714-20640_t
MRLIIALAASAMLAAVAAPAAAQSKECKAFRSGAGWAVKYVVYTRADGKVFDTVTTYTYQATLPEKKPTDIYEVNVHMERLAKPAKGVVILEYGKRPDAEALGKVVIAAPAYANLAATVRAGFLGEPDPVFKHRLVLKAGSARAVAWSTDAVKVKAPPVMEAVQFENAMASLGSSDIEALGPGGLADARKAAGIITQLARGGRIDIQVLEEGKPLTVGGFDIPDALAKSATDGAAAAKAEADLKASKGQCTGLVMGAIFNLSRAIVMVVDDNNFSLRLTTQTLLGFGIQTRHACLDAQTAVNILRTHPVDLLIVDCDMPGPDGYDL